MTQEFTEQEQSVLEAYAKSHSLSLDAINQKTFASLVRDPRVTNYNEIPKDVMLQTPVQDSFTYKAMQEMYNVLTTEPPEGSQLTKQQRFLKAMPEPESQILLSSGIAMSAISRLSMISFRNMVDPTFSTAGTHIPPDYIFLKEIDTIASDKDHPDYMEANFMLSLIHI